MKRLFALCSLLASLVMLSGIAVTATACDPGTGGSGGTGGTGGSGGGTGGATDRPHTTTGASWTVLVYMTADNDLEPFALQDLTEMMQVGSKAGFNLVVQVDRAPGYSEDPIGGLGNFQDTKRVLVHQGYLEQLADLGEQNMADPTTLSNFIQWGLTTYPADRTMLVFWDHGGGWTGFGVDETSGGALLKLPQIQQGVQAGLAAVTGSKPFQIIGFDACLMATYEVALTLAPHAEYLLASEEVEPGHGWDWTAFSTAASAPNADPVTLGKGIIAGFRNQATVEKTVDNVTLSLIDLYRMGTMSKAVGAVITAFGTGSAQLTTAFGRAQERALKFGDNPDPARATNMVDLQDLSGISATEANNSALTAASQQIQTALGQVIIDNTAGAARSKAKGMAIYFPGQQAYYQTSYDQVTAAGPWRGLLNAYFGSAGGSTTGVPVFTDANKVGTMGYDPQNNLVIRGTLGAGSAASISRAAMVYGIYYNSQYIELGDTQASFNSTNVEGSWNLSVLTLTQGSNVAYAYASLAAVDATRYAINILFGYKASPSATAQTCIRQIVFSADTAGNVTIGSDAYYVSEANTYGELVPAVGSTLMPLLKTIDPSTGAENLVDGASTAFVASAGSGGQQFAYTLAYAPLQATTVVFEVLTIENAAGQGDAVAATGTL